MSDDFGLEPRTPLATINLPAPSGAGKMLYDNGTSYAALPAGSSVQVLHGGATPSFGPVASTDVNFLPLAVSNGGTGYNLTGRVLWVTQLSDLGTPSGGYYSQIADTYIFANSAAINLGANKLKITGACQIYGNQRALLSASR